MQLPHQVIQTKFDYLKRNLHHMADLVLKQILELGDALDENNYPKARKVIEQDDLLDQLEKENDNISQSAILDAVASRGKMGLNAYSPELLLRQDPLRFALFAIRVNIYLEQMGDSLVQIAKAFSGENLPPYIFQYNRPLNHALARMTTTVGMAVESLVEEKDRFFGSIQGVCAELGQYCLELSSSLPYDTNLNQQQLSHLCNIVTNMESVGNLSLNIGEELVRLTTGEDVRHLRKESSKVHSTTNL